MAILREIDSVATQEEAIKIANEINRLESAVKMMKEELKKYVEKYGAVDTGEEVWDFFESVSWSFDKEGLKEVARNMAIEGLDPWELMNVSKPNLNKLGWDESFLGKMGKKKVTRRFTSRKNKNYVKAII